MSQRMIYQTEETRAHILAVAERLFLERGFFDTQMKDVAEAVGMSRNTLYRYYRDKTDLGVAILESVLAEVVGDFLAALQESEQKPWPDRRAQLVAVLRAVVIEQKHETQLRYIAEFDAFFSGNRIPDNFANLQDQTPWEPVIAAFSALIEAGIEEGSIRDDLPPDVLLQLLFLTTKSVQTELTLRRPALRLWDPRMLPGLIDLLAQGLKPPA
ncbi:TetR/AcrR family transcriptional regulator [Haliea sp. E17]|uniref:TetR/AcrR family transcriptional regulator n=1 Tax=Haliea sp. E17 TaxID=3401576 RepID=UPI003AAE941F